MKIKILCLGLTALAMTGAMTPARADTEDTPRQLVGTFCRNPQALPKPGACIALSFDGVTAQGYTNSPDRAIALRPGTYVLSVNDTSSAHNFSLQAPDGSDQDITGVAETPGWVTITVLLRHGPYVLFCDADDHRNDGMYVDIAVGGVGQ